MYAVIEIKGHQYIIQEWNEIEVDNIGSSENIECKDILCFFDGEWNFKLWKPRLDWIVLLEPVETFKWDKVSIIKFRRKNRYKRKIGFRPTKTIFKIKSIKINE